MPRYDTPPLVIFDFLSSNHSLFVFFWQTTLHRIAISSLSYADIIQIPDGGSIVERMCHNARGDL